MLLSLLIVAVIIIVLYLWWTSESYHVGRFRHPWMHHGDANWHWRYRKYGYGPYGYYYGWW